MRKIFVVLLVCVSMCTRAQQTRLEDSLLSEIQKRKDDTIKVQLYESLFYGGNSLFIGIGENLDEKLRFADSMLDLSRRLHYKKGMADGYNCIGNVFMSNDMKNINIALRNYYEAKAVYEEISDYRGVGCALANIGHAWYDGRKYTRAMDTLLLAKQILQDINDSTYLANTLQVIGIVFYAEKDFDEALPNFLAAKTLFEKNGNKKYLPGNYLCIAGAYIRLKKYPEATTFSNMGLNVAKELSMSEGIETANKCLRYIQKKQ